MPSKIDSVSPTAICKHLPQLAHITLESGLMPASLSIKTSERAAFQLIPDWRQGQHSSTSATLTRDTTEHVWGCSPEAHDIWLERTQHPAPFPSGSLSPGHCVSPSATPHPAGNPNTSSAVFYSTKYFFNKQKIFIREGSQGKNGLISKLTNF